MKYYIVAFRAISQTERVVKKCLMMQVEHCLGQGDKDWSKWFEKKMDTFQ